MITHIHGKIVFECDRCGEFLETGERDFQDALQAMRDEGWRADKMQVVPAEWEHKCAECSK